MSNPVYELRITASGLVPSLVLLLAIVLVPQLLAGSLSVEKAETLITDVHARHAAQELAARYEAAPTDRKGLERLAARLDSARNMRYESIRIRRGLIVPPFARRTSFFVEARRIGATAPEYFKVRAGYAYPIGEVWWRIRL